MCKKTIHVTQSTQDWRISNVEIVINQMMHLPQQVSSNKVQCKYIKNRYY